MWITDLTMKIENLASEKEMFYKIAAGYYRDVIEKEIVLANIGCDDHILCIGGGLCPFSAILFHQATGAKVTVIDNKAECISKAQEVISRIGIEGHVQVLYSDGRNIDALPCMFSEYTVVHFALQVYPLDSVFSHVEALAAPGTKILLRRPKKRLAELYSKLPALGSCPFTEHKRACNIGSTLLYIRPIRA